MMLGDVEVTTFPVSHDAICPVGFFLSAAGRTITVATDLGVPSDDVAEAIRLADLVVLEANHDTEMLHGGKYPYHLRRRIAGETGHLSNMQASTLAGRQVKGADVEVWLAHLSKENNTPELATRTVRGALRASGLDSVRVGVVRRDRPSLRWTGSPSPRQLTLFSPDGLA
jgi:phosphoribosyl 1,2-cyclic phosphodiesterase